MSFFDEGEVIGVACVVIIILALAVVGVIRERRSWKNGKSKRH